MKRRLNVLCVLVILVLSFSLFQSLYYAGMGAARGVEIGYNRNSVDFERVTNMQIVTVIPDNIIHFSDSVYNEKDGKYAPIMHSQFAVSIPTQPSIAQLSATLFFTYAHMLTILAAIIVFILIIISINKSDIFKWRNVSRLRWVGGLLVLSFICSAIPVYISQDILSQSFELKGYSIHMRDLLSITNLVLGLVAYIVAEVFAIGLRMQEEQELTI